MGCGMYLSICELQLTNHCLLVIGLQGLPECGEGVQGRKDLG
jgi:hypothetical protein